MKLAGLRFANIAVRPPSESAVRVELPATSQGGKTSVWAPTGRAQKPFLAWNHPNASVVHALTVFQQAGEWMVRLVQQQSFAFGGRDVIEAPAGKYGDTDASESALTGAMREVEEETGLKPLKGMMLSEDETDSHLGGSIATCSGVTNERKALALVLAEDVGGQTQLSAGEKLQNVRQVNLPLATLLDPDSFKSWRAGIKASGVLLGLDIPALRGLLPSREKLAAFLIDSKQ